MSPLLFWGGVCAGLAFSLCVPTLFLVGFCRVVFFVYSSHLPGLLAAPLLVCNEFHKKNTLKSNNNHYSYIGYTLPQICAHIHIITQRRL